MRSKLWAIAIVLVLVAAACGGGTESVTDAPGASVATDDSPTADGSPPADAPDGQTAAGSYFGGQLDEGYLQGTWCDSDGASWVFEGNSVQVGFDLASLGEPFLIEKSFSEPGATLLSLEGDEFVMEQLGQEFVFTRGPCGGSSSESSDEAIDKRPDLSNVALCVLLDQYKSELADLGGFEADPGEVFGSGAPFGGTLCSILIGTSASIDVVLFLGPELTIEMVAADTGDAGPAPDLGPEAVYVEATSHQTSDLALFPVRDGFVRVEATVGSVSIPRANLIEIAQLLDLVLQGKA
jgi:hypothetical protein